MDLSGAATRLSRQEMLTLQALSAGRRVTVSSTQRLRLEMLGLTRDRADGLEITAEGRRLARGWRDQALSEEPAAVAPQPEPVRRNSRGRRMPNQRVF